MTIRFLFGIPTAALATTISMWFSEMAETNKRGYLSIGFQHIGSTFLPVFPIYIFLAI